MDSPVSGNNGSAAGLTFLLEETEIQLSQPCLLLQDMISEAQANSVPCIDRNTAVFDRKQDDAADKKEERKRVVKNMG
jgi:hypothetical protein